MHPLLENCLAFNLRKVSRLITKLFNTYLIEAGIKYTQFCILLEFLVQKNKDTHDQYIYTVIGKELGIDRTAVRKCIKILVENGLLKEITGNKNKSRKKKFSLTQNGLSVVKNATNLHSKCLEHISISLEQGETSEEKIISILKNELSKNL